MKKALKILLICVLLVLILVAVFFQSSNTHVSSNNVKPVFVPEGTILTTTSANINGYTIKLVTSTYEPDGLTDWSKLLILKDEKIIFQDQNKAVLSGFRVDDVIGSVTDADQIKDHAFKDVTGDRKPELIFSLYSGGWHCCSKNYIIGLNDPIHFYLNLDTGNSSIEFKDINHDGKMEIETSEDVFAYWHTSFNASPRPRVVLSLQNDVYKPDAELMRSSAPSDAEIQAKANEVTSWSGVAGNNVPWEYAIDLIYSGNIVSARKYVDLAWCQDQPGEFKTKEEFWKELTHTVHKSPYYSDLRFHFGI
jgi:uncharacterized protein YxeA